MVKAAEARHGVRYDWVVRARPEFASSCVCPPSRPLSPSRIYSIDTCNIRVKAPVLCDAFWLVPRQWADVVFNAVDGWTDCSAYKSRFPCHEPSGLAPECMLTAWLVDHGIPRSAFGEGTELKSELSIVRDYRRRQPGMFYCKNLRRLSECAGRMKNASRIGSEKVGGKGAISTGVGKQRRWRLGAAGSLTLRNGVLQANKTRTRPDYVALSTARTRQKAARWGCGLRQTDNVDITPVS